MIHSVFFDIDGTLIDTTTHQVPDSTIKAIKQLHDNGYKVAIASGRDIKNIEMIPNFDLSLFDGYIASNGMCIFNKDRECIVSHSFPNKVVQSIIDFANKNQMTLVFETMNDIYCANKVNKYVDIANKYYNEITPPLKKWNQEPIVKITGFQKLDFDFTEIKEKTGVQILATPTTTFDFALPNISKLTGIHEIIKYWDFDENEFMCFGDHDNDLEMIKGAKVGIAVKDPLGSLKLQELADDTCLSASEDGIYLYLKEHKYI